MSLSRGDRLVKVDASGAPLTPDREVYILWKVVEVAPAYAVEGGAVRQMAVLEKLE